MSEHRYRMLFLVLSLTGFILPFYGYLPDFSFVLFNYLCVLGFIFTFIALFMPRPEKYRMAGIIGRIFNFLTLFFHLPLFIIGTFFAITGYRG
jgi:hypothetical protein